MSGDPSPDDDADEPAEESHGLTEDDLDRIREFARLDEDERSPSILVPDDATGPRGENATANGGRSSGPPAETCRTMRRRMRAAETVREVMEDYPQTHTSEVMRHVYGECDHAHGVPATASPQIGVEECSEFRAHYSEGNAVSEISDTFYRSDNTVTRHIFGRCSHPSDPRTVSLSMVRTWECDRLRRTYTRNGKVSVGGAATAMRLRPEVAATHLFGYCGCEGDEDPAARVAEWE